MNEVDKMKAATEESLIKSSAPIGPSEIFTDSKMDYKEFEEILKSIRRFIRFYIFSSI
jgi:hypothetical protein